jgi:hypothetical protein
MKVFVYGAGGYFESIIYPILHKYKHSQIYLANRRPLACYNYSKIFDRVHQASDINNFDLYFFAGNPHDSYEFLKIIPVTSKVWLEKPCIPLNGNLYSFSNLIETKKLKLRTGLSRRMLLRHVKNRPFNIASIGSTVAGTDTWKNMQVSGGSNYVDGVHAIDFALDMVGDGNITAWSSDKNQWAMEFRGSRKGAQINLEIGPAVPSEFKIDFIDFNFWGRDISLSCFKENLDLALQGESNFNEFQVNFTKIQDAAVKYNITF